jgi:hypothetical protein
LKSLGRILFDGKVFGETSIELAILKFRGTKRINSLDAFALEYIRAKTRSRHISSNAVGSFVSLIGVHHCQYRGDAFYMRKGQPIKAPVNSRLMIDAVYFQEANPNYTGPRISESGRQGSSDTAGIPFWGDERSTN